MSEYVITTDNNSDLPEKYLKDHGVGCMYLSYSMDGKNYTHGNFLPEHEFYEAMRNGSMPTTAQVNPENAKAVNLGIVDRQLRYQITRRRNVCLVTLI